MGKETILLSGDNERTANAIAKKTGIKNVFSQVLPQEKAEKIKGLQNEKRGLLQWLEMALMMHLP